MMSRKELFEAMNQELGLTRWTGAYRLTSPQHEITISQQLDMDIFDAWRELHAMRNGKTYFLNRLHAAQNGFWNWI